MTNTPDNNDRHEQTGDWIEWSGGECPFPAGTKIDVRDVDGEEWLGVEALDWSNGRFMWKHESPVEGFNIGAYRVPPKPHHFNQEGK
jgi:hypothetical protein